MSSIRGVPQPFPYQGSKRLLASDILGRLPAKVERLIEPFAGSAAVSLAALSTGKAQRVWINDSHSALANLWQSILHQPTQLADQYERLWHEQQGRERVFFDMVRADFNRRAQPHLFLYLLARSSKAAVRYNAAGRFNNSPDNRRLGMRPPAMRRNLERTSQLLADKKAEVSSLDYGAVLAAAQPTDVLYLDPPYQGVRRAHDRRYWAGVDGEQWLEGLRDLNRRGIPFLVSYDGRTGNKEHGQPLPASLDLCRLEVAVGRSSQATLLGRHECTVESLYLSPALLCCRKGKVAVSPKR